MRSSFSKVAKAFDEAKEDVAKWHASSESNLFKNDLYKAKYSDLIYILRSLSVDF